MRMDYVYVLEKQMIQIDYLIHKGFYSTKTIQVYNNQF